MEPRKLDNIGYGLSKVMGQWNREDNVKIREQSSMTSNTGTREGEWYRNREGVGYGRARNANTECPNRVQHRGIGTIDIH